MSKRTIELSAEQYNFLTAVSALMKSQDNQKTNFPIYCIFDKEADDTVRFITCFLTEEGMNRHLDEYGESLLNPFTRVKSMAYNQEISLLMKILVSLDDLVLPEHDNKAYE